MLATKILKLLNLKLSQAFFKETSEITNETTLCNLIKTIGIRHILRLGVRVKFKSLNLGKLGNLLM